MTFRIAMSGMNAAAADLNVTSHNIANVNTTGFKSSRAEFADVFPVSAYGLSKNAIGAGVKLAQVAQQFTNGNVDFTGRALDVALTGQGFFTLSNQGSMVYSRAGNFGVDRDGNVVNPAGYRLQAFQPNSNGIGFDTGRMNDLRLPAGDAPPHPTSSIEITSNLPSNANVPTVSPFNANDPASYTQTTSLTIYDSLGTPHTQSMYFVKTANPNEWAVHTRIDGNDVGTAATVEFDGNGKMTNPGNGKIDLPAWEPGNGASPIDITADVSRVTQYGERFSVGALNQNGYDTGRLTGIEVSAEGVVFANYTNGVATPVGQLALTSFTNAQGLQPTGNNGWVQTFESGEPLRGVASTSSFGAIQGGALEASNVELTEQLVNMITAQRNFQANAQMIQTQDQVTQTVINLR